MNDDRFSKSDLKRNEDPHTIAGAVGGATGIGIGAAVGMAVLGPVGSVVGALAGSVGGWWAGRGIERAVEDVDRADNRLRRAHEHADAKQPYQEVRHGYQLGYLAGLNPDNANSNFDEIEDDLRGAWVQAHIRDKNPVPWEEVRENARRGYELAREAE